MDAGERLAVARSVSCIPAASFLHMSRPTWTSSYERALQMFPVLPDATKYAMGTLKHSLHSCFFCYHRRTAALEEEVQFFNRRLGESRTLGELLSLRRGYRKSFGFVIRCLTTLARLH